MVKYPIWGNRKLVLDDEEYKRIEKVVLKKYPNICEEDLEKYVKHIFNNNVRQYKLLEQNPHRSVDGYDYIPKYLRGTKIGRENFKDYQYKVYCELEGSYLSKEELFDVWEGRSDKGMFAFGNGKIVPSRGKEFEKALRESKNATKVKECHFTFEKQDEEYTISDCIGLIFVLSLILFGILFILHMFGFEF